MTWGVYRRRWHPSLRRELPTPLLSTDGGVSGTADLELLLEVDAAGSLGFTGTADLELTLEVDASGSFGQPVTGTVDLELTLEVDVLEASTVGGGGPRPRNIEWIEVPSERPKARRVRRTPDPLPEPPPPITGVAEVGLHLEVEVRGATGAQGRAEIGLQFTLGVEGTSAAPMSSDDAEVFHLFNLVLAID